MTGNLIHFPPRLRLVSAPLDAPAPEMVDAVLVDHGGRAYRLVDLLARLTLAEWKEIEATVPWTGQAAWDKVVRRWPALAEEIVAGCGAE